MAQQKTGHPSDVPPVTLALARRALDYHASSLPGDVIMLAKQCMVDWFSVTIAALDDAVHAALFTEADGQGGRGEAHIIGHAGKYPASQAALVNGATAHALDFDDVNLAISGHPSAVIFSAVLALAERQASSGGDLLAAFVAGYETACRVGRLVCPDHLQRGFHATGTVSSFGAAAGCAHLLKLDARQTAAAMGIAGTQASGLKAMFGTMVKPLHAGLAARNGLEAALFIRQGFDSRVDILECPMGFAATHSSDFNIDEALGEEPGGFHLRNNLFKYEASCYGTHAAMECARQLKKKHRFEVRDIDSVRVRADRSIDTICNIQRPSTGMQGKFSIRLNVAFALLGMDTGKIESYSDRAVNTADALALRDKVVVELMDGWPSMQSEVAIELKNGDSHVCIFDAGIANGDLEDQGVRLDRKFRRLVTASLGPDRTEELLGALHRLEHMPDLANLLR